MIDCVDKNDCIGCKACGDICSKNAITYEIDGEGFWFPVIDQDRCVDCGACVRVCPILDHKCRIENRVEPLVYAAYHKDQNIRYNSTSGGLYYAIANNFLKNGGVLIGCAFKDQYNGAVHIVANDEIGLKKLMRSKYFQSDTEGIYTVTAALLKDGKKVLFSGAPCQVAALYNYVGKDAKNLFTVDFVCLGVNTPLAYQKFIEELEQRYHSKVKEVHFKNKSKGWTYLGTKVTFENGKSYYRDRYNDPWINAYIVGNLYMRKGCSNCRFKSFPRVSDMSFGDFWGPEFDSSDTYYGVSLAMVNNVNGDYLLDICKKDMVIVQRNLTEAIKGNPAISHTVQAGKGREHFFRYLQEMPYSKAVWKSLDKKWPAWWIDQYRQKFQHFKKNVKKRAREVLS